MFVLAQSWRRNEACAPREHLWGALEALGMRWVSFEEEAPDGEWDEMLPELLMMLRDAHVERAEVGGLWWNEDYAAAPDWWGEWGAGCASYLYVWLRDMTEFAVTARMDLAGLPRWAA